MVDLSLFNDQLFRYPPPRNLETLKARLRYLLGEIGIDMIRLSHDSFFKRRKLCSENSEEHFEVFESLLKFVRHLTFLSLKWSSFCIVLSITIAYCDSRSLKLKFYPISKSFPAFQNITSYNFNDTFYLSQQTTQLPKFAPGTPNPCHWRRASSSPSI